jgi:hypothetical protein
MNIPATAATAIVAFFNFFIFMESVTFALAVSDEIVFVNDEGYLESYLYNQSIMDRSTVSQTKVLAKTGRDKFFEIFSMFESYKKDRAVWTTSKQGRWTLSKMKYLICPVWFADEIDKPANVAQMDTEMQKTKEYYKRMSWNQHEVTWEFLPDLKLVNLTTKNNATRNQGSYECIQYINTLGKQYPTTRTGLIVAYNPTPTGAFNFRGGVAGINYNITWMSLPFYFEIIRHEVGHNYGHPHHYAYSYDWRIARGYDSSVMDGYDMMSNGMHSTRLL